MKITTPNGLIALIGDWHGFSFQSSLALDYAANYGARVVFQLGDFGVWKGDESFLREIQRRLEINDQVLYFIDGNHENFPRLFSYPLNKDGTRTIRKRIIHLPRGLYFDVEDKHFLAFGGGYSVDQKWRAPGIGWWPEELSSEEEIRSVVDANTKPLDALLMHDSPAPAPNPVVDDPISQAQGARFFGEDAILAAQNYRKVLSPLFTELKPKILAHGHYHKFGSEKYTHPTGEVSLVVSLDENTARVEKHVLILDLDHDWTIK